MKNLNFKPVKRDPRLSAVQRTIWGMIRLIAVGIPAPVAGLRARRVKRGDYCEALVDLNSE